MIVRGCRFNYVLREYKLYTKIMTWKYFLAYSINKTNYWKYKCKNPTYKTNSSCLSNISEELSLLYTDVLRGPLGQKNVRLRGRRRTALSDSINISSAAVINIIRSTTLYYRRRNYLRHHHRHRHAHHHYHYPQSHPWQMSYRLLDTKQLLDETFVISGIIKVVVSVTSRAEGRGW